MHGVLAQPRKPGPFPALLNLPGAGVRSYSGNITMAERGFVTLQLGVHGIALNLPRARYDNLKRGVLGGYPRYELDDPFKCPPRSPPPKRCWRSSYVARCYYP